MEAIKNFVRHVSSGFVELGTGAYDIFLRDTGRYHMFRHRGRIYKFRETDPSAHIRINAPDWKYLGLSDE